MTTIPPSGQAKDPALDPQVEKAEPPVPATAEDGLAATTSTIAINILGESYEIPAAPTGPIPESKMVKKITQDLKETDKKIKTSGPVQSLSEQIVSKAKELELRRHHHYDQFGNIINLAKEKSPVEEKKTSEKSKTTDASTNTKAVERALKREREVQASTAQKAHSASNKDKDSTPNKKPAYSQLEDVKNIEKWSQEEASEKTAKRRRNMIQHDIKLDKQDKKQK